MFKLLSFLLFFTFSANSFSYTCKDEVRSKKMYKLIIQAEEVRYEHAKPGKILLRAQKNLLMNKNGLSVQELALLIANANVARNCDEIHKMEKNLINN